MNLSQEPAPGSLSNFPVPSQQKTITNTKRDAAAIDFDDSFIYDQLRLDYDRRSICCEHFMRNEALAAFRKWEATTDKIEY